MRDGGPVLPRVAVVVPVAVVAASLAGCGSSSPGDVVPRAARTVPPVVTSAPPPRPPIEPATGTGPDGTCPDFDERRLRGLTVPRADRLARRHGCSTRVAEIDGRGQFLTSDRDTYRLDLTVWRGVVAGVLRTPEDELPD